MDIALILRAFVLSAMLCCVYSFPAQGYNGHQPLPQPGQDGMNPQFDPHFNNRQQMQPGQMETGWPSSSSTDVQQSGPPPPQTPGLYAQSSQDVSQMTFSAEAKGSMPQTSSGYEEFEAVPVAFDSYEPLEGRFYSPAPMKGLPQASPMDPYRSRVSKPESQMLFDPEQPNPELVVIAGQPPEPFYKGGKLIQRVATYEHGNEESEFHDSGYLQPPPGPAVSENGAPEASSYVSPPQEEYDDQFFQMFITGQLPPGTVTHFSSTDEHGSNAWTDISFERIPQTPVRKAPGGLNKGQNVSKTNTKVPQGFSQPPQAPWKLTAEAPFKRAW